MTEIYFVRHAHAHYSEDEYHRPLSAQGKGIQSVSQIY